MVTDQKTVEFIQSLDHPQASGTLSQQGKTQLDTLVGMKDAEGIDLIAFGFAEWRLPSQNIGEIHDHFIQHLKQKHTICVPPKALDSAFEATNGSSDKFQPALYMKRVTMRSSKFTIDMKQQQIQVSRWFLLQKAIANGQGLLHKPQAGFLVIGKQTQVAPLKEIPDGPAERFFLLVSLIPQALAHARQQLLIRPTKLG